MSWLKVRNISKHSQIIRSADGDSVLIQPMATATIDPKFNWSIPRNIRVVDMDDSLKITNNNTPDFE